MVKIKDKNIGDNYKTFIIAEIGLSHEGSFGVATSMIDQAAICGVDAVKFQMHIAEEESSKYEKFRKKIFYQDNSRYDYWKRTSFTVKQWIKLKNYSEKKNLIFLCSPFSIKAAILLKELNIDAWKIASGEFNNLLLIDKIIEISNKPLILSTGLTFDLEIKKILSYIKKKQKKVILLQCTSKYPTNLIDVGHKLIHTFKKNYKICAGISDHSGNLNSLLSAVALRANVIETHVCFDKNYFGPDTSSSITFNELKFLTQFSSDFYYINKNGTKDKKLKNNQKKLRKIFLKGLAFKEAVTKNQIIKKKDIKDVKPLKGISAYNYKSIIGKKINKDYPKNHIITKKNII